MAQASDNAGRLAGRIMKEKDGASGSEEEVEEEVLQQRRQEKDRTLFLGWRRDMADMIQVRSLFRV